MGTWGVLFFGFSFVNGVVAGIQGDPVYWTEVSCRASFEKVSLRNPKQKRVAEFTRKRVYDRLIIRYHKLTTSTPDTGVDGCAAIRKDATLVLNWLQRQKKVWGRSSQVSFEKLMIKLERHYGVSWK